MINAAPGIVGLVADLFFIPPIEAAAQAVGYQVHWIERPEQVEREASRDDTPGEPLSGQGAGFIAQLVEWQPALVLVDMSSRQLPWEAWIAALKSSPATRRLPVVAFGPHTDLALRARAQDVGCDVILAKSALLRDLPALIQKYARRTDLDALAADCAGELSESARAGIDLFNQQAFFAAHEALEHAWLEAAGPGRELYRALVQVAVAYLQIERGNFAGALKMFMRVRQWLSPLPGACQGIDVSQFRQDVRAAQAALEALGPSRLIEFDRALFRPVPLVK